MNTSLASATTGDPLVAMLDAHHAELSSGEPVAVVASLCRALFPSCVAGGDTWERVKSVCRKHPLYARLGADPFTARARAKPRGYAGDAVMIDYLYDRAAPEGTCVVGKGAFTATQGLPGGASVRHRMRLLANALDRESERVAKTGARAQALAIACGHLREAATSAATRAGEMDILAVDQDPESLAVVDAAQRPNVATLQANVVDVMRDRPALQAFDLIYAAGLTDYLPDTLTRRLARWMASHLRPGGLALIGNFTPHNSGRAYMEAFMDWTLVVRDQDAMAQAAEGLAADITRYTFDDPYGNVTYLALRKAG